MAIAPAMTLKRTYHWVPMSMRMTQPALKGMWNQSRARAMGRKTMLAGKLARTWTTGWRRWDHLGERPMRMPAGSAQAAPNVTVAMTRAKEARRARMTLSQSFWVEGSWRGRAIRRRMSFHAPQRLPMARAARAREMRAVLSCSGGLGARVEAGSGVGDESASESMAAERSALFWRALWTQLTSQG